LKIDKKRYIDRSREEKGEEATKILGVEEAHA
jgi:hypothetical protein